VLGAASTVSITPDVREPSPSSEVDPSTEGVGIVAGPAECGSGDVDPSTESVGNVAGLAEEDELEAMAPVLQVGRVPGRGLVTGSAVLEKYPKQRPRSVLSR